MARFALRRPHRLGLTGALSVTADVSVTAGVNLGALRFYVNSPSTTDDYARLTTIPPTFGVGEFTYEMWIRLDETRAIGAAGGTNPAVWATNNPARYSSASWWWAGNFVVDGHNNNNVSNGTFSFQIINANGAAGADIRWTFGDGAPAAARTGGLHAAQSSGLQLRDGNWHHVAAVRRWDGGSGAILELWVDGVLVATETTTARQTMRAWWDSWTGFPGLQTGWHFGGEKRSITDEGPYWDDYAGDQTEYRYYDYAKTSTDLATNWGMAPVPGAAGLVGHFRCASLDGSQRTYDALAPAGSGSPRFITATAQAQGSAWVAERPPEANGVTLTSLTLHPSVTGTLPYLATLYPLEGQVPAGNVLGSVDDANLRSSVVSTWPDGSAQVVTIGGLTAVTNGVAKTIALRATPPAGTNVTAARVAALVTSVACNFGAIGNVSLTDFSTPDFTWWTNPTVGTFRYRLGIGTDMEAIIDIHAFAGVSRAFVEVVIENSKFNAGAASPTAPSSKTYAGATVSVNGSTIATAGSSTGFSSSHQPFRAWYASAWVGGDPQIEVTHEADYLQSHPMFFKPLEATNKNLQTEYSGDSYTPWSTGRLRVPDMAAGGDSEQLALFTEEQADYIHSGNRYVRRAVIATGLAFHGLAFQWRHSGAGAANGRVPLRSQYLNKTTTEGGSGNWPINTSEPRYGGASFDGSHIPATTLVAFLCRPSPCFIEIAQKEFTWNHTNYGSTDGWHGFDQIRSRAWRLRNYAIAAFLTPDSDTTRKADYRTVLNINGAQMRGFFDKPWNTLGLLWRYGPNNIEDGRASGQNVWGLEYQHYFCCMAWNMLDQMKVVRDTTAKANWTFCADTIARVPVRIINESVGGEWRKRDINLYLGTINVVDTSVNQVANHSLQQLFGISGTPPASFAGTFLKGSTDEGGTTNWNTMPPSDSPVGYDKQFWQALCIAVERGVTGADAAWTLVYTNNGINNFQTWRQQVRPSPRFNAFARNKVDTKASTALSTAASGLASNAFVQFDGAGLNTSTTHPTLGTTGPTLSDQRNNGAYQMLGWSGKGCYDPVLRRVHFMGTGASSGSEQNSGSGAYQYNNRPIYNETANNNAGAWTNDRAFRGQGEGTTARAIGHTYDGNCIDLVNRRAYKPKFGDNGEAYIYAYNLDTGAMLNSIPRPSGMTSQNWPALEYIPTRGTVGTLWLAGYASGDALRVWEYDLAQFPNSAGWQAVLIPNATFGGNGGVDENGGPTMSFNPRANSGAGGVMIGHQSGCWTVTTPTGLGAVTVTSRSLPGGNSIDLSPSGFCRDPVGVGFLRITTNNVYRWDGSAWTARNPSVPGGLSGDYMVIPIDAAGGQYGVVWVLRCTNIQATGSAGFLYKP